MQIGVQKEITAPQEWILNATLTGHKGPVLSVAFHPRGDKYVSRYCVECVFLTKYTVTVTVTVTVTMNVYQNLALIVPVHPAREMYVSRLCV